MYVHGNNYPPGLSLDKLLLVMARLRYRVAPVSSSTTLVRLASCFTPPDSLTEQHINQVNINIYSSILTRLYQYYSSILTRLISVLQQHINITCLYSSQVHVDCQNISISWKMYLVFFFIFFYTDRLQNAEDWSVAFLVHTGLFWCFHNTPNSDKDYTIFSLRIQSFHHVYYARGPSIQFNLIQFNSI